jgi:hypothetical protein
MSNQETKNEAHIGGSASNAGLDTTHCKAPSECKHLPIESRADWLVHCERCKHDSMGYGAEDRYVPNAEVTGAPLLARPVD